MSRFIYRTLREDEAPQKGIFVVCRDKPKDREERAFRLKYHIEHGSAEDYKNKYFISLTEKLEVAHKYRYTKDGQFVTKRKVVLVDVSRLPQDIIYIKDIENTPEAKYLPENAKTRAKIFGLADSEVLWDEDIDPADCKEVSELMLDVFEAINVTICRDDASSDPERELLEFVQSAFFDSNSFEKVLADTSELTAFEQYFFERYYQQGISMQDILAEMNEELQKGDKLDISVIEALKVGIVKKLLNSDKTLEYLKEYNVRTYKSKSIDIQLKNAMDEKQKEKSTEDSSDFNRYKIYYLKITLGKIELQIKELNEKKKKLEEKLKEILERSKPTSKTLINRLQADVYPDEVIPINQEIISIEKAIKKWQTYVVKFHEEIRKQEKKDIIGSVSTEVKKLAHKSCGVAVRSVSAYPKVEKVLARMKKRTTSTDFKSLKNSEGKLAWGETGYAEVSLDEELSYAAGTHCIISSIKGRNVLVSFATSWTKKHKGGPMSDERIGNPRNISGKETAFGLKELNSIIKKKEEEFSVELKKKCKEQGARTKPLSEQAHKEVSDWIETIKTPMR